MSSEARNQPTLPVAWQIRNAFRPRGPPPLTGAPISAPRLPQILSSIPTEALRPRIFQQRPEIIFVWPTRATLPALRCSRKFQPTARRPEALVEICANNVVPV